MRHILSWLHSNILFCSQLPKTLGNPEWEVFNIFFIKRTLMVYYRDGGYSVDHKKQYFKYQTSSTLRNHSTHVQSPKVFSVTSFDGT